MVGGRGSGRRAAIWSGTTIAACRPSPSPNSSSMRDGSAASSITAPNFCRTGPSQPICRRAAQLSGGWTRTLPEAESRATCWPIASTRLIWLNGAIDARLRDDRDVYQRAAPQSNRQGQKPVRIDDASAFLARFENGSLATFEATRYARGHKALTPSRSTENMRRSLGTCTICIGLQYFDHRDEGTLRGWRSIHITDGDHPYMKHWWVPGPADWIRAHLRSPDGGLHRGVDPEYSGKSQLSRRTGN